MSGPESEIDSASEAALAILDKLNKELEDGPPSDKIGSDNKYAR